MNRWLKNKWMLSRFACEKKPFKKLYIYTFTIPTRNSQFPDTRCNRLINTLLHYITITQSWSVLSLPDTRRIKGASRAHITHSLSSYMPFMAAHTAVMSTGMTATQSRQPRWSRHVQRHSLDERETTGWESNGNSSKEPLPTTTNPPNKQNSKKKKKKKKNNNNKTKAKRNSISKLLIPQRTLSIADRAGR